MRLISTDNISITTLPASAWDGELCRFPHATVFHSDAWMQTVASTHGIAPVHAAAMQDGRCVAVWPFLTMRKGIFKIFGSPLPGWSTAYMGPLLSADINADAVLNAFLQSPLFRKHAYFACKVISRHDPIDLGRFGFTQVLQLDTYRVNLTLPDATLWGNLKSECRTRIRKAEKLGIEIREECADSFISDYWQMSIETFQKSNIQPTHNEQFVREMWNRLAPVNRLCVFSAFKDNERVATLVLPFDSHTMYYWGGASFQKHRDLPAHNLLHWHAINHAKKLGLCEYDFISTFGGPGRFKRTFGPEVVPIATHWEMSRSKVVAMLKRQYQNYLLKRRRVTVEAPA